MPDLTRRRLLGSAASAAALTLLPPSVRRAVAAGPPRRGSLADVEHVVLLMQENRSFDHYFGTLSGVRGFSDPQALTLATGRSVFHQPDEEHPDGYLLPFHLDTKSTSAQAIPSTSHAWEVQHEAWNGGRMDRWLPAHRRADGAAGPYVMGYHTRDDIPFQFALAETFTICDNYFCSVLGPTWPNRLYWMTGTIDPDGTHGGPVTGNSAPSPYRWTTYAERLEAAGVSWRVYQQEDNYGCNMLENFQPFADAGPGDPLHDRGLAAQPEGAFEEDARAGRLPTVSWLIPTSHQSEHPDHLPAAGADFVAAKIEAIAANPALWAKTAFILNYDENDGLFDHVPPPVAPPGTPDEYVDGLPIGAGFRVPCIIVSPWTVGGWVAGERFDHTSVLRFLERVTGVAEPNISQWRRRTFGDLTSAFGFGAPAAKPPALPHDTGRELTTAEWDVDHLPKPAFPGAGQTPPRQEPGSRRRR
ncbi:MULTISPECIES: alkaline phosphatase family protein [Streptomycetaceae]|uniref:phospholipase C n=1 Tax=Streptantibioticus cattleyicolor (strain ATCC 35852 / DSM 46488 / JCM 4925 / NBRC 14057 / NRRL 8057) TaxID=1003195 RepID=F8JWL7_STREN|nr:MULTISPECIES: alkaline phosphatase family protein [Streptomycetaceae]AEW95804.1 non-hemolytic phospholipase C [Streptantibioticus cattleyicolor NRRL 8057 = DSM 46488]MYS60347.1 phospholipase [Streptomyces sp. SID5468]CCB76143.1 Non-hemolytic phospholipase C [Streptantibioticus cattleyicolor NRRL 8057 = DSM 46488]